MKFIKTTLNDAYVIEPEKRSDERGFFARVFCLNEFKDQGLDINIVQANVNFSVHKGTLRGMHYQNAPYQEDKIVRCTKGSVFDVIIDIREDSSTFKKWFGIELSENNHKALFVPKGFAHGFVTLEDNSEVNYLVTQFYTPSAEGGVRYNDPEFKIEWPIKPIIISDKDANHPDFIK